MGKYCYVASARRRATGEERGGGILCRHAHCLLLMFLSLNTCLGPTIQAAELVIDAFYSCLGEVAYWAFTRYDHRTDRSVRLVCPTSRMKRLHVAIVGPTGRSDPGYVRLSVRPVGQTVGQTVAEPPTSVNQINVAC